MLKPQKSPNYDRPPFKAWGCACYSPATSGEAGAVGAERARPDQLLTLGGLQDKAVSIERDVRVVFSRADRIMVLGEGAVLAGGTPGEIAAGGLAQAAYLGQAA